MKKQVLTTLMLMLVGMTAWAQSGWTDPSSEYQLQTAVYLTIDCGEYDMYYYTDGYANYNYTPEVAAFVDGELRQVLTEYITAGDEYKSKVYAFRVGGTANDTDKEITFKVYDERSGIIYPLSCDETITWTGDATSNYPSEFFTMTFTPATSVKLFQLEADMEVEAAPLSIHVNEEIELIGYFAKVYDAEGNVIEVENEGMWDILYNDNMPYVSRVESPDGAVIIRGEQETPESEDTGENMLVEGVINYAVGSLYTTIPVQVLPEYFPVTSIEIADVNYYWKGFGRLSISDDMVTYNGGETTPTNPGVKIVSSSNEDVVTIVGETGLDYQRIGSSVITVAAIEDESITTTFTINILSALEGMHMDGYTDDAPYTYDRHSDGEEYLQLPTPLFDWIVGEDGGSVIGDYADESYTLSSDNTDVLRIDDLEDGLQVVSLKKGVATVTYTSVYDPTKQCQVRVIVSQNPSEVKITQVGATEVTSGGTTETIIDVAVDQEVTAVVQINPNDADYETFVVTLVDNDDIPYEADVVEVSEPVANGDGAYNVTFKFIAVPDRIVRLKAVVDGQWYDRVRLNVRQSVTAVELGDVPPTIWLGTDESYTFSINATVSPDDATDKSLTVTSSNVDAVTVGTAADGAYTFEAVGKGTAVLTFTSVDNPSVSTTCESTVKRKVEEIVVEGLDNELYNDGVPCYPIVSIFPEDADYDMSKLSYRTEVNSDVIPEGWEFISIEEGDVMDGGMLKFIVTGRSLCNSVSIVFTYDAAEQGDETNVESSNEVRVIEKVRFNTGWNWVSFISGGLRPDEMEGALEEARSQTSLVIADPQWGLFGNLDRMESYEAYKINIKEEAEVLEYVLMEGGAINGDGTVDDKVLEHGWNWESYPYEYAYNLADIFDATQFNEGDIILSKEDGFATIADGAWEGDLQTLRPNQGYLIYSNVEAGSEVSISMPNRYTDLDQGTFEAVNAQFRAPNLNRSVWNYDGSRFANVMAIIGKVSLDNTDGYSIGAFVGNECRGEGKFINGKAYITAAGEAGEVVTLRLYNEWTGEYTDLVEEVAFTDLAGSAKAPIRLTRGETTAIKGISAASLTIQGNVAVAAGAIQVYDVQGKLVAEGLQRVDLSHLGQGVYVVKAGDDSRKVIK